MSLLIEPETFIPSISGSWFGEIEVKRLLVVLVVLETVEVAAFVSSTTVPVLVTLGSTETTAGVETVVPVL
jgi:hypothetical protein